MISDYRIKELDVVDLKEALALVWNVFLEFEAPDYCEEGIREFKEYIIPNHEMLHTQSKEYVVNDIIGYMKEYEVLK